MTERPIRVLLACDRPAVSHGLEGILAANPDIEVVANSPTLDAAIEAAIETQPDVVVVDDHLSPASGVETCRAIRDACPSVRALLLVSAGGATALTATALAGATGYVIRDLNTTLIQDAVIDAGHGRTLYDPDRTADLLHRLHELATDGRRDRDLWRSPALAGVLDLVGAGLSDHEIGEQLDIPVETVRDAVKSLVATLPALRR